MKKPVLSVATEAAAAVTVATAQREVQPAVTDSQPRVVRHNVLLVNIFSITVNNIFCVKRGWDLFIAPGGLR